MLVQTLRVKKGWTQEQLAVVSGLSVRTIQRIERGEAASAESLKALAAAFDVDFATLKEPSMTTTTEILPAARTDAELLLAYDHVRRKQRLQAGYVAFAVVMPILIALNLYVSPARPWVIAPAVIWAALLLVKTLRLSSGWPWGADWEKREVEKRLGRPL